MASALMADENNEGWTLQVTATSEDSDSDGTDSDIASYEIRQVRDASGAVVAGNGVFAIDPTSGVISISGALDYETSASYALDIQATDTPEVGVSGHDTAETGTTTLTVTVQNVIDQSEDIILMQDGAAVASYTASVDEGASAGTLVVTISASVNSPALGSEISYGTVGDEQGFVIDSQNGEIIIFSVVLDYETATSHTLTVRVTYDEDGTAGASGNIVTRDVEVVINVNDVGIRLRQDGNVVDSYTASVDEGALFGTVVVTLDASADDAAQDSQLFYHFVHSDNTISDEIRTSTGIFEINTSTGQITSFVVLDYETTPRYELTVRVTYDADGNFNTKNDQITRDVDVVINVTDVPGQSPAITPDRQSFAHQDSYDPDDLGLTPMPDADPSAG